MLRALEGSIGVHPSQSFTSFGGDYLNSYGNNTELCLIKSERNSVYNTSVWERSGLSGESPDCIPISPDPQGRLS